MLTDDERARFRELRDRPQNAPAMTDNEAAELARFYRQIEEAEAAYLLPAIERSRQERLVVEAQNAELRDLILRYSAILERLEAELVQTQERPDKTTAEMRKTLRELAERSEAVAAAL